MAAQLRFVSPKSLQAIKAERKLSEAELRQHYPEAKSYHIYVLLGFHCRTKNYVWILPNGEFSY